MRGTTVFIISLLCFPTKTGVSSKHTKPVKAQENCGHPYGMISGKIVGGYDVGYYKYPWFVSLYKDDIPYCGSTLVTKKSIVTAAHCYQQYLNNPKGIENEYELRMGTYNICNTHEATLKTYKAKKVYIHEKYANEDPFFDIALIVLAQEVPFEPACLPIKPYDSKERPKEALIAGYGVLRYLDYKTSCILIEARIRIYSDKECKKMLKRIDPEIDNFANAFCAGYLEGGVDTCQGDSGGPLMVLQSGSRFALLGLTSFGYKCAEKNLLGVYTDVSKFLDWIQEKTNAPIADNPGDNGEGSGEDDGDYSEDQGDDNGDENGEGDDDDGDDDEGSDDDGGRKKRKSKRVGNETSVGHHRKCGDSQKHHHNKKSLRTKTVFEIKKMNKKRHKADSKA